MQTNLITGYTLSLVGPEIADFEHIIQAAREAFTANPPSHLRDAAAIVERIASELDLPDFREPAAITSASGEATPIEPIEAPVPATAPWQWGPKDGGFFWIAGAVGRPAQRWADNRSDYEELLRRGNVYRTGEEAAARAQLDVELALSAHLRQLGGGETGRFAVRYDEDLKYWGVLHGGYDAFAPGEARFESAAVAIAARNKLRAAGLLPHEQLAPVAAEAPAEITGEVPGEAPALDSPLHHNIMVLLLTPPGWPAPAEVWEAIRAATQGPQS